MRILIVIPYQDRNSGNWVTARRFQLGLKKRGHQALIHETQLQADNTFKEKLRDFSPDIVLLLHAYRSGKPWLETAKGLNIPYVVLLTGTDVNHGLDDPAQSAVIYPILQQATFVLLQNHLLLTNLATSHPELAVNLRRLTPGIILGTAPYDLRNTHDLPEEKTLFLCPAGLRPVKGVLELLEMFDQVAAESSDFHLAFCGPILDEAYSNRFLKALSKRPWASYLGAIPSEFMTSAMRCADIILNNSQTEGLANALLEAATIGIPILAKEIPGNAAVVTHGINGLLYNDKAGFSGYALQLLNRERRQQLSCPATNGYNPDSETAELITIFQDAIRRHMGKDVTC